MLTANMDLRKEKVNEPVRKPLSLLCNREGRGAGRRGRRQDLAWPPTPGSLCPYKRGASRLRGWSLLWRCHRVAACTERHTPPAPSTPRVSEPRFPGWDVQTPLTPPVFAACRRRTRDTQQDARRGHPREVLGPCAGSLCVPALVGILTN